MGFLSKYEKKMLMPFDRGKNKKQKIKWFDYTILDTI